MKHQYTWPTARWWHWVGLLLFTVTSAAAQSYQLPLTGTNTVTTCSGIIYDDGGAAGDYGFDANGSTTILPAISGNRVRLQFTAFNTESFYDRLTIFDGTDATAPILGIYDGTNSPGTVVATNSSGALTLRFVSDGAGNFAGFAAGISCVAPAPLPDLLMQMPNVSPSSVAAGNTINVNSTIVNTSVTAASTSNVGYYLSTNNVLDASDVLVGFSNGGTLFGNSSSFRGANVVIPVNTAVGNYFLLCVADYQGVVNESNEANNVAATTLTVVPPGVDLIIQGPQAQPSNTAPGNQLNLSCNIVNQGTSVANSSTVGYYLSTNQTLDANDQLLTSSFGGALGAPFSSFRSASTVIPVSTTPGTYYVLFAADFQNVVNETNEQNNVASVLLTISAPSVDLTVQQPFSSATSSPGSSISLNANIVNLGNTTANSSTLGFYLSTNATFDANDVALSTQTGGTLNAGQSSFRSVFPLLPTNVTPGSYFILFVADPLNQVGETNEQNNVVSRALTVVAPFVDLVIQQPSVNLNTTAGATLNAFNFVNNQGNSPSTASTTGYYLSTNSTLDAADVLIGQVATPGVAGNDFRNNNASLVVPAGTAPGNYFVLFVTDYLNQVTESNEQNNVASRTLAVVLPSVDLVVQQPGLNPVSTVAGASVSTFSFIFNQGNTQATSSSVGYYLSTNQTLDAADVLLGQSPGGTLDGGQWNSRNAFLTIPAATAPGSYFMLFVADHLNVVSETNEQNNVTAVNFTILTPGVDLVMTQQALTRQSAPAGSTVNAFSYISNIGTTGAASSNAGFYLSTDNTLSSNDVLLATATGGFLSANDYMTRQAVLTIPGTTTPGSYHVLYVADPQNQVTETNEQNNVASLPFTVTAPFNGTVVPYAGSNTITSCGTTVYDHGGTADYGDGANGRLTIVPATAGARVRVTLTSFDLEQGYDYLRVYDGASPSANLLGTYTGFQGLNAVLTATNSTGALTLEFTSDGSIFSSGFEAVVTCVSGGSTGSADLLITQSSVSSTSLSAGGTVTLGSTIRNQGTGNAGSSTVGFYLSTNLTLDAGDVLLANNTGGLLGTGQQAARGGSYTVPAGVATGTYNLLVVADPLNAVSESNEQNNVLVHPSLITITGASADLTVSQPTVLPSPAAAGGTISVTCFNQNIGSVSAAQHSMGIFLSTDNVWSTNDVLIGAAALPSMAPGFGTTRVLSNLLIPSNMPLRTYYVLYVADYQNLVIESNEQNNVASTLLVVDRTLQAREQAGGYAIDLFPNPTSTGTVNVRFAGVGVSSAVELVLFNSLGQQVGRQELSLRGVTATATFETDNLSRGVYTLRAVGKGINVTRRVVVE